MLVMSFNAQQVIVVRDSKGNVVEGDPVSTPPPRPSLGGRVCRILASVLSDGDFQIISKTMEICVYVYLIFIDGRVIFTMKIHIQPFEIIDQQFRHPPGRILKNFISKKQSQWAHKSSIHVKLMEMWFHKQIYIIMYRETLFYNM